MKLSVIPVCLVLTLVASGQIRAEEAPKLKPYNGTASGSIVVKFDSSGNETVVSQVTEHSNVMGTARQIYSAVDVSRLPLQTSGLITSVNEDGDRLNLSFILRAVAQTSPTSVVFTGEFHVLGGSGEFRFSHRTPAGDFGSGTIQGTGVVDPSVPGQITLQFRDTFHGTILAAR
jgi:hypothetical protein